MPGFIQRAAESAAGFDETIERVRAGIDHGQFDQRPELDAAQQREFLAEQADGRTDEPYRQALLYHGFTWYPLDGILASGLPGTTHKTEGEWRNGKLKLAFTPQDLASGFPAGPESLDRYLRDQAMARAVTRGRVPKKVLREARLRRP